MARKSRVGDHWDKDDYDVRLGDASGGVVGRIFGQPRAPKEQPWFWTIRKVKRLGFSICFHDLRGTHSTLLLDHGVPVHVVAARCGQNPATLLRSYAKRTRKADTNAASVIGSIARGVLKD